MAWGSNLKLGQSVVAVASETVTAPRTTAPAVETDYAGASINEESRENEAAAISRIDVSLRQRSLLLSLSDNAVPTSTKMARIGLASANGLLPASFRESTVVSPSLQSGGLMNDWDFQLE
jgi:hypothetical protein